jgi:hypothetical protein
MGSIDFDCYNGSNEVSDVCFRVDLKKAFLSYNTLAETSGK